MRRSAFKQQRTLENAPLQLLHHRARRRSGVVVTAEMQQPMDNVKTQLAFRSCAKGARLARCRLRANDNLTVPKREHVSRTRNPAKLLV
jgi:hypothetical protein